MQRGPALRAADGELAATFDLLEEQFMAAGGAAGEEWIDVGGQAVHLRAADVGLLALLMRSLVHLRRPPAPRADLTVLLWDLAAAGQTLPPSPFVPGPGDPPTRPIYTTNRYAFTLFQSTLSVYDRSREVAMYCVSDTTRLPLYESASSLRFILHWWAARRGLNMVHSAAVGTDDGGVLLTGPGGSGKSTSALACLRAGFAYLGDDYVLLSHHPPRVHSLYASAKLDWEQRNRYPDLLPEPASPAAPDGKACAFLDSAVGSQLVRQLPLRAVLLPVVTDRAKAEVVAASAGRALRGVAPATVLQLPVGGEGSLRAMAQVVSAVPCYELRLGTDLGSVVDAVRDVLDRPATESA